MLQERLRAIEHNIYTCAQCAFCTATCPVAEQKGWETYGPRGKMYLLKLLIQNDIQANEEIKERFYACTTCSRCAKVCQTDLELVEIWEDVRSWLVEDNLGPLEVHRGIEASVAQSHNTYRESAAKRDAWAGDLKLNRKGKIAFFVGCTSSYRMQQLAQDTMKILQSMGEEIAVLGEDEWCCGSVLLRTGQRRQIKEIVEHNVKALKNTGAEIVVASCTGCFKTISGDYPPIYGSELPFKMMHISLYLAQQIESGKLKFTKSINEKVTYHDPCHLGLHAGEYEAPRAILKAIPGLELIEMDNIREESRCCGAGGGLKAGMPDVALAIGQVRVDEAEETGASILASCCPFCKTNLSQAIEAGNKNLVQKDITALVVEAMGLDA
ncbi:(Fe-S)-binding protein [Desulfosporosinus sp. Sb-LF]|uniref:(Fe-S)-binding protein n=1 Tax=Desulfosporosinus sp. Sb-LF TaxID=2560027 RepID=UPI00107EF477|nr:(Fe-S)-binding protein [Desulfosporosinus sp. Sb-LF]TGE31504.1 (Fe-S)-binding protein [Desulfosporosinus sp. Sb-LF]